MTSTPVKIGLIGCGRATEALHLPALRHVPESEVVAVADTDPKRLHAVANQFRIPHRHADYRALLRNPAVEVAAVCVPAAMHLEVALAALEAEKHLFVEKPLTLTLDEADRLVERAGRSSKKATVGFNLRWHRLIRQAKTLLDEGRLGPLELVHSAFTSGLRHRQAFPAWRDQRETGGGVLFEIAIHHFDLWRFLLQSEVEEVFVRSRTGQGADESASLSARLANGVLATAVLSQRTADSNLLDIHGQAGRLHVSCYQFDGLHVVPGARPADGLRERARNLARTLKSVPEILPILRKGGDYLASYCAEWQHFIECIQQDRTPECSLDDGRRALQVVLAATASASSGAPVRLAQAPRSAAPASLH